MKQNIISFKPIQPLDEHSSFHYQEFMPSNNLKQFIYCYWNLQSKNQFESPLQYNVITDGCVDIYFDMNLLENSYIMGFHKSYKTFNIEKPFHYFGIRFFPSGFPTITGIGGNELKNAIIKLADVFPELQKHLIDLNDKISVETLPTILNLFFENYLARNFKSTDSRILQTLHLIYKEMGNLRVDNELEKSLCTRHFNRLMNYYIGSSTKSFCNVVRFQSLLSKTLLDNSTDIKLYLEMGYFDQAHFIKDFKAMYGKTPGKVLNKKVRFLQF
jgi:hypothetical protein